MVAVPTMSTGEDSGGPVGISIRVMVVLMALPPVDGLYDSEMGDWNDDGYRHVYEGWKMEAYRGLSQED